MIHPIFSGILCSFGGHEYELETRGKSYDIHKCKHCPAELMVEASGCPEGICDGSGEYETGQYDDIRTELCPCNPRHPMNQDDYDPDR